MQRPALLKAFAGGVIGVTLIACAVVQVASDALARDKAEPFSLPRAVPRAVGLSVYRQLERVSTATFIEQGLASAALDDGDIDRAQHYAQRMLPSPWRDELFARIAQRRGDDVLAYEYYVAAGDAQAVQDRISALILTKPREALDRERAFTQYLEALKTHPDAVAAGYAQEGLLEAALHDGHAARRSYERAMSLSPLNMTYLLSDGNQAILNGELDDAQALFRRALSVIDPRNSDAYAGLGLVALRRGDRATALRYEALARASDPHSSDLAWLERELR